MIDDCSPLAGSSYDHCVEHRGGARGLLLSADPFKVIVAPSPLPKGFKALSIRSILRHQQLRLLAAAARSTLAVVSLRHGLQC